MSATLVFALIALVVVVLVLFWLATAHYVGEVLSDSKDDGHGGAGH
ncbi:hypothetical protein [Halosegnis marinus]|uniref:Uncharacterized protein n=1 Tax=Halosegnis marinus TaxID=3034023 RepID=A0ABD5ZSX9_9EURY|nr:hypothetical protein [Halosegnis sp. DT85]